MFQHFLQRSIKPKTRYEKFSLKDKVSLEKNRIGERVGWQARMQQANAPATSALLTSCSTGAAGYMSNSDRFHTDTVGEEYAARQVQIERQKGVAEYRRNQVKNLNIICLSQDPHVHRPEHEAR